MLKKNSFVTAMIIVCIAVFLTFTSASALDTPTDYVFAGEAKEGYTSVIESEGAGHEVQDICLHYTLNADESGYYCVGYSNEMASVWAGVTSVDDCVELPHEENVADLYETKKIYYLTKGSYRVAVDIKYADVSVGFSLNYLGAEISDIEFKHELIDGIDFCFNDEYSMYGFSVYADAVITFSSGMEFEWSGGKEFASNPNVLCGIADKTYVYGKTEVDILFLGEEIKSEITVYPASYFIKDVKLSHTDYYLESLKKNEIPEFLQGETFTVIFTDGTNHTFDCSSSPVTVKLPNSKEYDMRILFEYVGTEDAQINIYLEDCTVKTYDLRVSVFERIIGFFKNILLLLFSFFI